MWSIKGVRKNTMEACLVCAVNLSLISGTTYGMHACAPLLFFALQELSLRSAGCGPKQNTYGMMRVCAPMSCSSHCRSYLWALPGVVPNITIHVSYVGLQAELYPFLASLYWFPPTPQFFFQVLFKGKRFYWGKCLLRDHSLLLAVLGEKYSARIKLGQLHWNQET